MALHNELGKNGEELAAEHLIKAGFKIVARNWRYKRDEIDIIASNSEHVIFVEVKTRTSNYIGNPEEAVTQAKQKRLVKAAHAYLETIDANLEARFDIIAIISNQKTQEIKHIADAFQPQW